MKRLVMCCSLLSFALMMPSITLAGEEAQAPAMSPEMQEEMMAWMKLAEPGPHHAHLGALVGSWEGEVTMWMDPDMPPMVESSTAKVSWMLGGRFIEWKHTGNFMGSEFEGRSIEGYNNGDGRYESIWADNFGTLMLNYSGTCSNDGKSRIMVTEFRDAVKGGMITYTSTIDWSDADHFTYTAVMDKGDGKPFKNMEIKYSRK